MTQAHPQTAAPASYGSAVSAGTAWPPGRVAFALGLVTLGVLACLDAWTDIVTWAMHEEEQSHIFLVPLIVVWLVMARRDAIAQIIPRPSILGPAVIALGGVLNYIGFTYMHDALWHGGAVLVALGCWITVTGTSLMWRLLPAYVVLGFLVPVPGMVRQRIAIPMQTYTASATQWIYDLLGMFVERNGNLLRFNGQDIAVAEACNGMRMVFALILVTYAVVFALPLRAWVRVTLLVLSPLFAIACNVVRLVPTVWAIGHYPKTVGPLFHQAGGWVMIGVAFVLVMGVIGVLRWAELPVMREEEETREGGEPPAKPPTGPRRNGFALLYCAAAVLLLGVIGGGMLSRPEPADAEPYHARVREASKLTQAYFGNWVSQDEEVPQAAQRLLKPNVIISRRYSNLETRREAMFVLVHCKDARDMIGHYPPNCYPNSGYTLESSRRKTWEVDGRTYDGVQYVFVMDTAGGVVRRVIDSLLLMPDGRFAHNMAEVTDLASDHTKHFFGAGQVQVEAGASLSEEEREEIFAEMIRANLPLIEAIQSAQ